MPKSACAQATAVNRPRPSACSPPRPRMPKCRFGSPISRSAPAIPSRALALYQAALRQDPNSVVALVNLGRLYGSSGLLDQAIALWREALKRNPCLAEAGTNLQIALRAKNDTAGREAVRRSQEFCAFE